jgi:hypothetical protein
MTLLDKAKCAYCNKTFAPTRTDQRYCSKRHRKLAENARRSFARPATPKAGSSPTSAVEAAIERYVREVKAEAPEAPEEQLRLQAVAYALENPDRDLAADLAHIKENLYCLTPCEPCQRFLATLRTFSAIHRGASIRRAGCSKRPSTSRLRDRRMDGHES